MEIIHLDDIRVCYQTVDTFPHGITEAFQAIQNRDPTFRNRAFYGISHMDENGKVVYKAGAEEHYEGEGAQYGYESMIIRGGNYLAVTVDNFMENLPKISEVFSKLLDDPRMDMSQPCVEWYKNPKEAVCIVRVKS